PPPPAPPQQQYAATMLSRRDQEPSESSPLTYREVSYALAIGTEEPEAEAFALQMLEELKREIPEDRAARFINIAVFDEIFTGKPTISPLVVVEWKDWKGPPVARYPRKYPSALPGSMRSVVPGPGPGLAAALKEPSQVSRAPAAALGDMFLGPATAPGKSAAGPATSIAAAAAAPLMPAASNPALAPQPVPSFGPVVAAAPPPVAAPEAHSAADASAKVKTQPLSISELPAVSGAKRLSGDELIADLFEEMHAMNFHEDAVAAGYFCLDLALSKIPADGGLVHFYDVDKREYVVACARGPNAHALLLARHPDLDPFLGSAPRSRSAVIFQADGATPPRFAVFGGLKNLVVAPLWPRGRFMGAVEFINPKDGAPFTADDANALTYIAEQLAEFIGSRGVVLDARRITRPPPADTASAAKARS
ncbi:MAG: GAF domain-containing protein, partial [Polyangiaceae bacterium]|nr:GAF domain-containing protein [Polyangiaceae bacterium]